jgi:nicotinamide mononucleotide transporter PnuC
MQFVGFYLWRRISANKINVQPRKMKWYAIILTTLVIAGCTAGFYYIEQLHGFQEFWNGSPTDNTTTLMVFDSLTLVLGTGGMIMMVIAVREQWILWILLDIAVIIVFSINQNSQMIAMSATALLNALYGIWNWWRAPNHE